MSRRGRPQCVPDAFARATPAFTLSRIRAFSNSATAARKTSQGEVVPVDLDPLSTRVLRTEFAQRGPDEWLVAGYGGRPASRTGLRTFLTRMEVALGVQHRVTGKVFRQTHITLSRMAGIADIIVMAQHGHSSLAMTDTYTRVPVEARREAARKLAKVLPLDPEVGT